MEKIPKKASPEGQSNEKRNPFERTAQHFEFNEAKEEFRGTLGFDFIFVEDEDGKKHCYCVEINGEKTGVIGMEDVPEDSIDKSLQHTAQVRARYNPRYLKKYALAKEIEKNLNVSEKTRPYIRQFVRESLGKEKLFTHAEKNPPFIEKIGTNKKLQWAYIPEEHRPREYREGGSTKSRTGYWICKPFVGQNGKGILILSNTEFEDFLRQKPELRGLLVAQEFLTASGAHNAPQELKTAPASLRYLVDFRYLADGTIEEMFKTGYQRVAPISPLPLEMLNPDERNECYVVNKSTGALSVTASEEEMRLSQEVVEQIIHNIALGFAADNIYVRGRKGEAEGY